MKIGAKEIAISGVMLGLALLLDVAPLDFPTVWGMKIDVVAVPIILVYFLLGFWGGVFALGLLFLGLSVVSSASWLGAMMKTIATFGVLIGLEVARRTVGFDIRNPRRLLLYGITAYVIGVAIRIPLMLLLNYYVALPIWLGLPREQVVQAVEKWTHVPFWVAIGLPNAIQSVIDVFLSLVVAVPVLKRLPHIGFEGSPAGD
ncbi:ECF transporter S component [Thermococcus sp.]|uniref:ECF transporter S component n=1 Tax=Thermococcus sp. TaxID=35749 RepID=UPI002627DFAA|nr:ECF transporter S component [Thermococcus sp.]